MDEDYTVYNKEKRNKQKNGIWDLKLIEKDGIMSAENFIVET